MVSLKAGLALAEVRKLFPDFRLPNDPGDICPKSGHPLKLRMGKAGLFIACAGYPDCDFTVDIPETEEDPIDASELEGQTCDDCGSPMKLRTGRDGSAFLGCTAYPTCRNTVPVKVAGARPRPSPTSRPARPARSAGTTSSRSTAASATTSPARATPPAGTGPEARHDDGRRLSRVPDGRDPGPQGAFRTLLRLLELPGVREELPGPSGPQGLPVVRGAVPPRPRAEGGGLLRLREGRVRFRRAGRGPRPLYAGHEGPRGGPRSGDRERPPRRREGEEARRETGPEELTHAGRRPAPRAPAARQYLLWPHSTRIDCAASFPTRVFFSSLLSPREGRRAAPVVRLAEEGRPAAVRDLDRARGARADPGPGEVGDVGAERPPTRREVRCRGRASRRSASVAEAGGRPAGGRVARPRRSRRAGRRRRRFPTSVFFSLLLFPRNVVERPR